MLWEEKNPLWIADEDFDLSNPLDRLIFHSQKKIWRIYKIATEKKTKDNALTLLRNIKHLFNHYHPWYDEDIDLMKYLLNAVKWFVFMPQDAEVKRIANILEHSIHMAIHLTKDK